MVLKSAGPQTPAMLVSIGMGPASRQAHGAIDLMVACHSRIRSFTRIAARLAEPEISPVDRSEAAASVHRYYSIGLPLHVLDEDVSLMPRLWAVADASLRKSIATMADQHSAIEELVSELLPRWREIKDTGARPSPDLAVPTSELQALWDVHLVLEEMEIFPAAQRLLSPSEITRIGEEMRERRDETTFGPPPAIALARSPSR
jgi:hemerythrin-like domain-containing protein